MTTSTLASKIAAASKEVGGKLATDKRNTQQNYDYVSADKILERAGQSLAEQGIAVFPAVTRADINPVEYSGSRIRYDATVNMIFTVHDGETQLELPFVGCGSDYAVPDKAVYKAITSGHKYFLSKLLNIGAGNEDGEHEEPEPKPATKPAPLPPPTNGNHAEPEPPERTSYEADMLHVWDGDIAAAKAWAVEQGACENEFAASNSLRKIVEAQFGGRLHTGNREAVLLAFLRRQQEKLAQMAQQGEAVTG